MSDATDQQLPPQVRQPTIQDIIGDLPKIREIARAPMASNPLLGTVSQLVQALEQVAQWAALSEQVASTEQHGPGLCEPIAASNGHDAEALHELAKTIRGDAIT